MRRLAVLALASLSLGAVESPQAVLIAHRSEPLPRNAHLFVREKWRSLLPPNTSFALRKKGTTTEFPIEDRIQPLEGGRLHEIVPAVELDAHATYELTLTASGVAQTFAVPIGELIDRDPPVWDEGAPAARDSSALAPIYVVWRAGSDGLVDVDGLPTEVVMSLANLGTEGYVALQAMDFAGHRLEPRELALGGAVENPDVRRARLVIKRAATKLQQNPVPTAVTFAALALVVYVIAKRKRHFA